jgi:hypothetical protein
MKKRPSIGTIAVAALVGALALPQLFPSEGRAYPGTPSVSLSANPVVSYAGAIGVGATESVFTAPSGQRVILTDVVLGVSQDNENCRGSFTVALQNGSGAALGSFAVYTTYLYNAVGNASTISLGSGIPVDPEDSLSLVFDARFSACSASSYELLYTLSGYMAAP